MLHIPPGHSWRRIGQLGGHQDPVPVLWMGWRSFTFLMGSVMPVPCAANSLCPPNSRCFKMLPGVLATSVRSNSLQKVRFWCLTNCGTRCQTFRLPQGVHFPPDLARDHGSIPPSPARPTAVLSQARHVAAGAGCCWHGVFAEAEPLLPVPPAQRGARGGNCC